MDTRFFASKYFAISAVIALVVMGGAAAAWQLSAVAVKRGSQDGCAAPALGGSAIDVAPEVTVENDGARRTVVYRLDAASYAGGVLDACSPFGDIDVTPSAGDEVEITFVVSSRFPAVVDETMALAELRELDGRVAVAAWVPRVGHGGGLFGDETARVRLHVRLPDSGAWDLRARSMAGDVRASDLMARELDLRSSFGDVVATGIHLSGNATLGSSAGDVILALKSVQTAHIKATSSFGDVEVEAPQRADVGYDVSGDTNLGEVTLRIGPTEEHTSDSTGVGERESARSVGFASKPTRVTIVASSSAGDIRVVATGSS
ncbi:MAG TPA: DUF4097 family beta strand repeat-containing protein [Candidatus Thermoplasmatota archaeon]|nr:DUF4097 family beta strand repeat-containing protein [Candidatus Thermoplasmatota archaeon]